MNVKKELAIEEFVNELENLISKKVKNPQNSWLECLYIFKMTIGKYIKRSKFICLCSGEKINKE